jgi:hypothetical protein
MIWDLSFSVPRLGRIFPIDDRAMSLGRRKSVLSLGAASLDIGRLLMPALRPDLVGYCSVYICDGLLMRLLDTLVDRHQVFRSGCDFVREHNPHCTWWL